MLTEQLRPPTAPAQTTAAAGILVPFALYDGRLVEPTEMASGLHEGLACPGCGGALVAKHPKKMRWHFAHHRVSGGINCGESAVHAAAKQVLLQAAFLRLPPQVETGTWTASDGYSYSEKKQRKPVTRATFERVDLEVTLNDVRPDAVGYLTDGRRIAVEFFFRHRVDDVKRARLRELEIEAVEVDLADLDWGLGLEAIRERVLTDVGHKTWLHYAEQVATKAEATQLAQSRGERERAERLRRASASSSRATIRSVQSDLDSTINEQFAAATEEEKFIDACARLEMYPKQLPHLMFDIEFRFPDAFGARPLLWQTDFFATFLHNRRGHSVPMDSSLRTLAQRFGVASPEREPEQLRELQYYCQYLKRQRKLRIRYAPGICFVTDPSLIPVLGPAPTPLDRPVRLLSLYRWNYFVKDALESSRASFEWGCPSEAWPWLSERILAGAMHGFSPAQACREVAEQFQEVSAMDVMRFLVDAQTVSVPKDRVRR
jgi:hypothetical protein